MEIRRERKGSLHMVSCTCPVFILVPLQCFSSLLIKRDGTPLVSAEVQCLPSTSVVGCPSVTLINYYCWW